MPSKLDLSPEAMDRYTDGATLDAPPSPDKQDGLHPGWWAGIIGANLADAMTTSGALKRGAVEKNPALKAVADRDVLLCLLKGGLGAGQAGLLHWLHKKSPTGAKIGAAIASAIPAMAAIRNAKVAR